MTCALRGVKANAFAKNLKRNRMQFYMSGGCWRNSITMSGKETLLIAVLCQCLLTCGGNTTVKLMKSGHNTRLKLLRLSEAMDDPCVHKLNTTMLTELRVSRIEQGIQPSTINREIGALSAMFTALISSGNFLTITPFKALKE